MVLLFQRVVRRDHHPHAVKCLFIAFCLYDELLHCCVFLECAYLGYPLAWFMRSLCAFHPKRDDVPWRDIVHIASTILGGISVQNSGSLIWLLCLAFQDLFPVLFFVLCTPVLLMA